MNVGLVTVGDIPLMVGTTSAVEEMMNSVTTRDTVSSIMSTLEVVNDVVLSGTSNVENVVIISATPGVAGRSV